MIPPDQLKKGVEALLECERRIEAARIAERDAQTVIIRNQQQVLEQMQCFKGMMVDDRSESRLVQIADGRTAIVYRTPTGASITVYAVNGAVEKKF